jgi:hypothetical protein
MNKWRTWSRPRARGILPEPVFHANTSPFIADFHHQSIRLVTVTKNNSGTGYTDYIKEIADRNVATRTCYTLSASAPLKAIDNSTWAQINMAFTDASANAKVTIYSIALTVTENP